MFAAGILKQFDIIDPHHLASVNVDNLLVEEITRQKKKAFRPVGNWPSRSGAINAQATVHRVDRTERHHPVTRVGAHDQDGDPGGILLWSNRQFAYTPALAAAGIKNRASQ